MKLSRRQMCLGCAGSALALTGLGCATAAMRGRYDDESATLTVDIDAWPDQQPAVLVYAAGRPLPVVIVRERGEYRAMSSECTHQGCGVSVGEKVLRCPCHGSTFDLSGKPLRGPASTPLRRYSSVRNDRFLIVDLRSGS